ncbi:MAG: DUF4493 domain-containing protein [Clostridiales bacterium]|nr:DUF4493 domain-containing protein [Clostridiales bacterium]
MKNRIISGLMMLMTLVGFSSCNEKWEPGGQNNGDQGTLSTADLTVDVTNAENVISRASIDLSNFKVSVVDEKGNTVESWTYASMPGLPVFNVGTYTLMVESGNLVPCAFDQPYFKGEKQFTINKDAVTNAGTVTCTLANLKVSVIFKDDLVEASAGDLNCEIRVNESAVLNYAPGETRPGYYALPEGNITMVATFTGTVNGYKEEIIRLYKDLNPGQHRIITFALKGADITPPAETGFIDPTGGLNVDFSVTDEDLSVDVTTGEDVIGGDRPGHEDWPVGPDNPDNPKPEEPGTKEAATFTSPKGEDGTPALDLNAENPVNGVNAVVEIDCPEGAKNLVVTISSSSDSFMQSVGEMMPTTFDLADPRDADGNTVDANGVPYVELIGGLGLPVTDQVIGEKNITFNVSSLVPLLASFPGNHSFTLDVVDQKGNKSQLVLKFKS